MAWGKYALKGGVVASIMLRTEPRALITPDKCFTIEPANFTSNLFIIFFSMVMLSHLWIRTLFLSSLYSSH